MKAYLTEINSCSQSDLHIVKSKVSVNGSFSGFIFIINGITSPPPNSSYVDEHSLDDETQEVSNINK